MGKEIPFLDWANVALAAYPLRRPAIQFIRHSENITFRVTDGRKKYLLRIHKPRTANLEDLRQQPQAIESELLWMDALRREAGIPVPPVIPARDGELVTTLPLPGGAGQVPCSLFGWVQGEPFQPEAESAPDLAVELGRLTARLHNHASAWQPPAKFLRPRTGSDHAWRLVDKLAPAVGIGILSPADYAVLRSLAEAIVALTGRIEQTAGNYGLIHNDLHTGNWLVHGREIIPLDFSLCGFGYHLFDIAIAAGSLGAERNELRRMFFDGYLELRLLAEAYVRSVEAFFITSAIGYYAFVLPDPSQHEWLYERIPRMLRTIGQKFLREEPFFFDAA